MPSSSWVSHRCGAQLLAPSLSTHTGLQRNDDRNDSGFSLIEIVVSIFILAILSLALLPPLIQGIKQAAGNAILASATHIVSSRMDAVRQQAPSCAALTNYVASAPSNVIDSSGVTLHVATTMDACPAVYPATVGLTVTVTRSDTAATLVTAKTLVYVLNAS